MNDIQQMLERQARWQKARRNLPWPEKIRMAERVRESILPLRATKPPGPRPAAPASVGTTARPREE
jgi:hypothetical protein